MPPGGHLGSGVSYSVGGSRTLTGMEPRVSMVTNPDAPGPKGWKSGWEESDSKIDVPSKLILVLTTLGPTIECDVVVLMVLAAERTVLLVFKQDYYMHQYSKGYWQKELTS